MKDALQRRGALVEQQRTLAADNSLAVKQIELNVVEEQIKRAIEAWRERAAVSLFLERIREDYERHRQPETLKEASGYLRQLGPRTLAAFRNRILNIHPGPLPRFGGHGMYGAKVHEAVIASGVAESGIVIHLVDEEYDRGPVIARRTVPVLAGDTPGSLGARIQALEPGFFVETLQGIVEGRVRLP